MNNGYIDETGTFVSLAEVDDTDKVIANLRAERDAAIKRAEAAEGNVVTYRTALDDLRAEHEQLRNESDALKHRAEAAEKRTLVVEHQRQRAEAAELSLKLIEADNRDLEDAHRRIGELEKAREDEVTDSELAILENVKLRERIKELQEQLGQTSDTNPVQELTQEVDRKTFGHLQDRVKELEAQLSDAIERAEAAEWQDTGFCPRCHADELRQSTDLYDDELNLSVIVYRCGACGAAWAGDPVHWVDLAKQLTAMQWRAEAAEAKVMELRLDLGATVEQANKAAMELAAVPVDEITFLWRSAPRNSASQRACMRVGDWLQSFRK